MAAMNREQAATDLLAQIDHLRTMLANRREAMVASAIGTGHTSLVRTVDGIGKALDAAYNRVERITQ